MISEQLFLVLTGTGAGVLLLSYLIVKVVVKIISKISRYFDPKASSSKKCSGFATVIVFLLLLSSLNPYAAFSAGIQLQMKQIVRILLILSLTGFIISLVLVLEGILLEKYRMDETDNLRSRKVYTQVKILRKILFMVIILISFLSLLMSFENFRRIGTALLASAGVAGLIIGLAAQKTLGAVLSGLQLAITQPIRIDDVVVVENEWGRVEELTLTYIVIRTWDLRRLIVPTSYFLEKPFQNWTRISADLLGTVFIYTDYNVPVEDLRKELSRIISEQPEWDGKVMNIQVTDSTDKGVQLRALISASDSSRAWDLRCSVREKMIEYIRQNYPGSLPRTRVEVVDRLKNISERDQS